MNTNHKLHKIHLELLTGKFHARIAEFWFKYAGYTAIAAGISLAASKNDTWILFLAKWISYAAIYAWLEHEIEKCFYYIWPDLEPKFGYSPRRWHLYISNTMAGPLVLLAYYFGTALSNAIDGFK